MKKKTDYPDEHSITIKADTTAFDAALKSANDSAKDFGRTFTSTIKTAIMTGKNFEKVLNDIALRISKMALNKALAPIEGAISNLMGSFLSSLSTPQPFAKGGAFSQNGIVTAPTLFGFGGKTGVMGEAGPEAVMPLTRGADGRLGVAAAGAGAKSVNVVFNVNANDAASFNKSESQITAMLARAVMRGQRNL